MSWIDGLRHRVRTLFNPDAYDAEMDEEFRHHADLGAQTEGDRDAARRRFGNRTYHKEEARRMTWLGSLDVLRQDASYSWRSLRRSPVFTATVVATLAVGLGLNAAAFSVLDRLYLRPPDGVRDPANVRRVWINRGTGAAEAMPFPVFRSIAAATGDSTRVAAVRTISQFRVFGRRSGPLTDVTFATPNYFSVLGVRPAMGRFFAADEDQLGVRVAVVSDRFWRNNMGADSTRIGKPLLLDTIPYVIIGVTPPGFYGIDLRPMDVWVPMGAMPHYSGPTIFTSPRMHVFRAVARATAGMGLQPIEQRATAAMRERNRADVASSWDTIGRVVLGPLIAAQGPGESSAEDAMSMRLYGVSAVVLLIAAANVINLLLARAVRRRREIAVRLALGISRSRLIRLVTTEAVLLSLFAGGAALLAGWWGGALLRSLLMPELLWPDSAMHWRVALVTVAAALLCGIVAGIVPAFRQSSPQLTSALKDGAHQVVGRQSRLAVGLVVTQTAMSLVLLVVAALFVRSLRNVEGLDLGFQPNGMLVARMAFEPGQYPPDAVVGAALSDVRTRLVGRPGVVSSARSGSTPMAGLAFSTFFWDSDSSPSLRGSLPTYTAVDREYFETAGLRVLKGRVFEPLAEQEVVVNEAMARLLWHDREPIGQCLQFGSRSVPCHRVTGVVTNSRRSRVIEGETGQYFLPLGTAASKTWGGSTLVVRVTPEAADVATKEIESALKRAFPAGYPVVRPMSASLEPQYRPWRAGAKLFTAFGVLAFIVAVVGVYSTISYSVSQRTQEFGVRIALGASVRDVLDQVLGEGLRLVGMGLALGVLLSLAAGQLVASQLFGVAPNDFSAMLFASCVMLGAASVAAMIPAWRAARVDPMTALRTE